MKDLKLLSVCVALIACGGCATIVMTDHQDVELVNIPKNTRIETMHGIEFDLIPGVDIIDLKRSRDNPHIRIYCKGSKYPRRKKLRTRPNLAFWLGNLIPFPIAAHIVDIVDLFHPVLRDRAWDYSEPIDIGAACRSAK